MISCYPWPSSPIWAARAWVIPCLQGGLSQQNQRTKETNSWLLSLKSWVSGFRQKRFGRIFDQSEPTFPCPRKIKIPLAGRQEASLRRSKKVRAHLGLLHSPPTPSAGWMLAWVWVFHILRTRRTGSYFQVRIWKMGSLYSALCQRSCLAHLE